MSEIKAAGSIKLKGPIEFNNLDIGGSLKVEGDLTVNGEFRSGGSVVVDGNLTVNRMKSGGSVKISGTLIANELAAGGSISMATGVVRELDVGGSLTADTVYADRARISGTFKGVLIARSVVVEKKSKIKGRVIAGRLLLKRKTEVDEAYAVELEAEREAEVGKLACVKCLLGRGVWVGLLLYKESYEADKAEIDRVEKVEEIPELERLRELEEELSKIGFK
ncbi:MAG: polymer-forming cytoskeletal protein [Desulfurococcales archaeon]|nr:polymer-forming cytoskeletal protein [Desulfurococcales archaeon]